MIGLVNVPKRGRREWIGLAALALPCLLYSMDLGAAILADTYLRIDVREN